MSDNQIPWWEPKLGPSVKNAVLEVLESTYINDGPVTRALEERIAQITGVKFAAATPSCTSALAISLMAAGVGPGDEVIVPDVTFIATANAVRLAGGNVRLVDVDADRLTISPERVQDAINPKTKAVIAVDFNGRAADYISLENICHENDLALICDSAQGLGSRSNGKALGSYGKAGCFSFSGHKMFFGGQGGSVVTNDPELHSKLLDLRNHGRIDGGPLDDTLHQNVGFNFKYPGLMASVVLAQLDELNERMTHATQRDNWYRELFSECPEMHFPFGPVFDGEVCLWADMRTEYKDDLMVALNSAGIGFRGFFLPLHRQVPYVQSDEAFPNAVNSWKTGIWLPSALSLTRDQAQRVANVCRKIL